MGWGKLSWKRVSIAVIGVFFVSFLLVWSILAPYQLRHANERNDAANAYTYDPHKEEEITCAGVAPWFDRLVCLFQHIDASREDQRAKYDLQAQQEMAEWSFAILLVSGLTALITGVGVFLVARTLKVSQETLGEAGNATRSAKSAADAAWASIRTQEKIGENQTRALLYVTAAEIDYTEPRNALATLYHDATEFIPNIFLCFSNVGQSPPKKAKCTISIRAEIPYAIKNNVDFRFNETYHEIPLIFPREEPIRQHIYISDIDKILKEIFSDTSQQGIMGALLDRKFITICGRVQWTDIFDKEFFSEFAFQAAFPKQGKIAHMDRIPNINVRVFEPISNIDKLPHPRLTPKTT